MDIFWKEDNQNVLLLCSSKSKIQKVIFVWCSAMEILVIWAQCLIPIWVIIKDIIKIDLAYNLNINVFAYEYSGYG